MDGLTTLVINLHDRLDKWEPLTGALAALGWPHERLLAIDGRGRDPGSFPAYDARGAERYFGRPLSGAEVACFLSHRAAVERFLDGDAATLLVLEDDAVVDQGFPARIALLSATLSGPRCAGWHVVNLGRSPRHLWTEVGRGGPEAGGLRVARAPYFPLGTFGLLWSRDGARHFLDATRRIEAPVDHTLRRICARSGQGYACLPPAVGLSPAPSDIKARRRGADKGAAYLWAEFRRQNRIYLNAIAHRLRGLPGG